MFQTYAHFEKIRAMPNRKKPIIDGFKSAAATGKHTANCCAATACMSTVLTLGCCGCDCFTASVTAGDQFRNWLDILSVYNGKSTAVTDGLFLNAMSILKRVEAAIHLDMQKLQAVMNSTSPATKGANRFGAIELQMDYNENKWLHTFYRNVMWYIKHGGDIKYMDINNENDLSVIIASIPMFYMAMSKGLPYNLVISEMERKTIEYHLARF
jgi:hypothetical protein